MKAYSDRCSGCARAEADMRVCGKCGGGKCSFCGSASCLRGDTMRPGSSVIDGEDIRECGRYIYAGELVATWITLSSNKKGTLRFALCMGCYRSATLDYSGPGLPPSRFTIGRLRDCIPCGYHTAVIEEVGL